MTTMAAWMLTRKVRMSTTSTSSSSSSLSSMLSSVVGSCWIFLLFPWIFGAVAAVDTGLDSPFPCKETDFSTSKRVTLCHNASVSGHLEVTQCTNPGEGLMLTDPLVLAPLSHFKDCSKDFNLNNLYSAQCMQNLTQKRDLYDDIVFDLLEKVSGKNVVSPNTVLRRLPMSVRKDGDMVSDSSSFVTFKKSCKPVTSEGSDTVIHPCSNQTININKFYFSLRGRNGVDEWPDIPSMCQCVLRPKKKLDLLAVDLRLQNALSDKKRCGRSSLKIESNETKEVHCHGKSALYGLRPLYSSNKPDEVMLTLTYIDQTEAPTSVWIQVEDEYQFGGEQMNVTCSGFIPLPKDPPDSGKDTDSDNDNDHDGDDEDGDEDDNNNGGGGDGGGDRDSKGKPQPASPGPDFNTILIISIGSVVGIVILVFLILCIVHRRRNGSFPVMPCCRCCSKEDDNDDGLIFYKPVTQQEPVYAEPGRPRPSNTTPYTFPADAKFPVVKSEYAEPDPNGTLSAMGAFRRLTPPPIPEQPPPSSPPPPLPASSPPPKPERTLLRPKKGSKENGVGVEPEGEEDYDHIVTGGKTPLKTPPQGGRDRQNNIIGRGGMGEEEKEEEEGMGLVEEMNNVYDCLRHGGDYSHVGDKFPKRL